MHDHHIVKPLSYIEISIELSDTIDHYIVTAESCVDRDIYYVTSLLYSTIGVHIAKPEFADECCFDFLVWSMCYCQWRDLQLVLPSWYFEHRQTPTQCSGRCLGVMSGLGIEWLAKAQSVHG